jgi:nitrate reductase NapD
MKIASVVVRVAPEHMDVLTRALLEIPGVEVHGASRDAGRLIATVEDGAGHSMADSLIAVNVAPHVLGLTLAYEYTDEGLELEGAGS